MGPRAVNVDFTGATGILVFMSNVLCSIYYIYIYFWFTHTDFHNPTAV